MGGVSYARGYGQTLTYCCHDGKAALRPAHEGLKRRTEKIGTGGADTQQIGGFDCLGDDPLVAAEGAGTGVSQLRIAILVDQLAAEGTHVVLGLFVKDSVHHTGHVIMTYRPS